ncbi:MAG TPA: GH116 family glycosyl hydrolase, partial [Chitinivibrionales bacterium]
YPVALYEMTVVNTQASGVDVALALVLPTTATPSAVAGKGIQSTDAHGRAVYVSSDAANPVLSYGNDNGFMTSGACNNTLSGTSNKVAMKITLAANETRHINFAVAWYNSASGYTDRFYYATLCSNAGGAADKGLTLFSTYKKNALAVAAAMRGSNFPDWLINQTQNTLSLLSNNSIYMKDGRYIHTEGQWNTNGTMDQQWAARFIMYQMIPKIAWNELEYWARTQRTSPDTADGQIHHDMTSSPVPWDQTVHADGSFGSNADWIDLNCNYIVSVYENFAATADTAKLSYHWSHVKRAAQRIVKQLKYLDNSTYPCTFSDLSKNTYDVGGSYPFYNATLASLAFKTMTVFADIKSEPAIKTQFDSLYKLSTASFEKRWLTNNFPSMLHCESIGTGQWMAYLLGFGEMYPAEKITYMLDGMKAYYKPETAGLGFTAGSYNEWAPYFVTHYGGLCIQTGRFTEWKGMQQDWFNRDFLNRNLVFNIQLGVDPKVTTQVYPATDFSGQNQYISDPVIWRTYYDLVGFRRNAYTRELALEPKPLPEMNHVITNASVFVPEGIVTVNYSESGTAFLTQNISCAASSPIAVSKLYVRDLYGSTVGTVKVNGATVTFSRVGTGFAKELCLNWSGTIGPQGITVVVSDQVVNTTSRPANRAGASAASRTMLFTGALHALPGSTSENFGKISVYDLSGRLLKTYGSFKEFSNQRDLPQACNSVYIVRIFKGVAKF